MKKKRKYKCPPTEVNGLTPQQVNLLRAQQNPEVLLKVYEAVVNRVDNGMKVTPNTLHKDTGFKRDQIVRAMKKIDNLLYKEAV